MSKLRKPRIAIAYDFDGTLAPGNMQEHQFIPEIGMSKDAFWEEVGALAKKHQADNILMYMELMIKKASDKGVPVRLADFKKQGSKISLFPGVETWFDRINAHAKKHDVIAEHYIISSGNSELIQGTKIYAKFERVYASSFKFNENDVADWPALAVNYTNKTQFLFRINKGALDVHDEKGVNKSIPEEERPVPFKNMVFIGDGETDIPCFRLVKDKGGLAIAVYKPKASNKTISNELLKNGRVHCAHAADYSEGKELEKTIFAKIQEVSARHELNRRLKNIS